MELRPLRFGPVAILIYDFGSVAKTQVFPSCEWGSVGYKKAKPDTSFEKMAGCHHAAVELRLMLHRYYCETMFHF